MGRIARSFNRGENVSMKGLIGSLVREVLCSTEFWRMEAINDWHLRSRRYVGLSGGNSENLKFA